MYETASQSITQIVMIYVMFGGACILTYPITMLIVNAAARGVSRWR